MQSPASVSAILPTFRSKLLDLYYLALFNLPGSVTTDLIDLLQLASSNDTVITYSGHRSLQRHKGSPSMFRRRWKSFWSDCKGLWKKCTYFSIALSGYWQKFKHICGKGTDVLFSVV